jgi:hypothetical protein
MKKLIRMIGLMIPLVLMPVLARGMVYVYNEGTADGAFAVVDADTGAWVYQNTFLPSDTGDSVDLPGGNYIILFWTPTYGYSDDNYWSDDYGDWLFYDYSL